MTTRLYVPPDKLDPGTLIVDGDDFHYLFRVLRLRVAAEVDLFDGAGRQAAAEVIAIDRAAATLQVGAVAATGDVANGVAKVHVLLPLIKGERMSWCIQKLVELGVSSILPIQLRRCVVRLEGDKLAARRERYVAVARAAARQCRRSAVPRIGVIGDLLGALEEVESAGLKIVFWEGSTGRSLRFAIPNGGVSDVAVLVGPEGGLAPEEVDTAINAGFLPAGLGPRILRAETAAVAAVSILGYELGDLG